MQVGVHGKKEIRSNLKVAISPKLERPCPQKLLCMHITLAPKCINFLANSNQFYFYATMDGATNIVHVL